MNKYCKMIGDVLMFILFFTFMVFFVVDGIIIKSMKHDINQIYLETNGLCKNNLKEKMSERGLYEEIR